MAQVSRQAFSPNNHKITLGLTIISGYAKGNYLTITPNTDIASQESGSDSEINTTMIGNNTATATVRVYNTNPSYKLLRATAVAFQTTGTFLPFASINIADATDNTISADANIIKHSTDSYSNDVADLVREYAIFLHNPLRV